MNADEALTAAYPRARLSAIGITGDVDAGEDLVQSAMLRLWAARDRYATDDYPRLLFVAMRNIQRDHYRHSKLIVWQEMPANWVGRGSRQQGESGNEYQGLPSVLIDADSPEALLLRAEERARVRGLVLALNGTDRDALVTHYWRDLTPQGTRDKSRAYRARKNFKTAWEAA